MATVAGVMAGVAGDAGFITGVDDFDQLQDPASPFLRCTKKEAPPALTPLAGAARVDFEPSLPALTPLAGAARVDFEPSPPALSLMAGATCADS
jgi:hypothetical protein